MRISNSLALVLAASLGGAIYPSNLPAAEPGGHGAIRERIAERVKEQLGLTDDQIQQIKAVLAAEKETVRPLLAEAHEARAALRTAVQSDGTSEQDVRAAAAKVAAADADLAVERHKLHQRINPILTQEQREKVKQLYDKIDELINAAINRVGERSGNE